MDKILEVLFGNPQMVEPLLKGYIDRYKPVVYSIMGDLFGVFTDLTENKKYYQTLAKHKWNMYSAYVDAGFTNEQAMALILNDNLQLAKNISSANQSASSTLSAISKS